MKIFEENGWIRLQLMDMTTKELLFDFHVAKEYFPELKNHIIQYLNEFKIKE